MTVLGKLDVHAHYVPDFYREALARALIKQQLLPFRYTLLLQLENRVH